MLDLLFSRRDNKEHRFQSTLKDPEDWLFEALGAQPTATNISVNERNALQITAYWSAVNTISDTVGALPIKLIHHKKNGGRREIKTHPALRLVKTAPNEMMTPVVQQSTQQSHALTHGNGYAMINFNRAGEPAELWPLPTTTEPVVKDGKLYYETTLEAGAAILPASDVLHIPALARRGIKGMSILREQREALGHAIAVNAFGSKFFANGAKPGGLVSFKDKIRDPEKVRKAIAEQYTGENVHGLLVLDNDAQFSPFAIPPDDAQFLQTKEFTVDDIGRMFRLPAHFLNKMGQATFNNLEQMGTHFVQYTMIPWLKRWEEELTRKLLTETEINRGYAFRFVVQGLMRGDNATRSSYYSSGIQNGWLTRNEVRGLEEMNPIDGLDEPLTPANMNTSTGTDTEATDGNDDGSSASDGGDSNTESSSSARGKQIVRMMVQRLVAKESKAVERMEKNNVTKDDVEIFYARHAEHIAENLAIDLEDARQYCAQQVERFGDASFFNWLDNQAADELTRLATEGEL